MFCAMIVSAWPPRVWVGSAGERGAHRGPHVRRQIRRGPGDQFDHAVEEVRKHPSSIIEAPACIWRPPPCPRKKPPQARRSRRFRIERDPLGEVQVPADAYYGAQTQRAVENFPISGLTAPPELVTATILIKKAAAQANAALGRLPRRRRRTPSSPPPTRSSPARCAISSSSTSTRPAPAPRTT